MKFLIYFASKRPNMYQNKNSKTKFRQSTNIIKVSLLRVKKKSIVKMINGNIFSHIHLLY